MAKRRNTEGTRFLRYFGPLLEALRKLGGSGKPDEVVQQVVTDLARSDEVQNELVPSGGSRLKTNVAWARSYCLFFTWATALEQTVHQTQFTAAFATVGPDRHVERRTGGQANHHDQSRQRKADPRCLGARPVGRSCGDIRL